MTKNKLGDEKKMHTEEPQRVLGAGVPSSAGQPGVGREQSGLTSRRDG